MIFENLKHRIFKRCRSFKLNEMEHRTRNGERHVHYFVFETENLSN